MTHVGQKLTTHAIGLFGFFLGFDQQVLGTLDGREVLHDANEEMPVVESGFTDRQAHREQTAIAPAALQDTRLVHQFFLACVQVPGHVLVVPRLHGIGHQHVHALPHQSLHGIVKNGRRGSLTGYLTIKGVQGHVAYPHLVDNPIHKAAPALAALSTEVWDHGNAFFPATSFQISNIHAGTGATNVVPGDVQLTFNFRYSTEVTAEQLQQRVLAILEKHELNYSIDWILNGLPFLTDSGELVAAAVHAVHQVKGFAPSLETSGGTSDGRFIAPTGAQVLELGVLNATIHQINEHVNVDELDPLTDIYEQILENLLT